jgi:hypothetical protein
MNQPCHSRESGNPATRVCAYMNLQCLPKVQPFLARGRSQLDPRFRGDDRFY